MPHYTHKHTNQIKSNSSKEHRKVGLLANTGSDLKLIVLSFCVKIKYMLRGRIGMGYRSHNLAFCSLQAHDEKASSVTLKRRMYWETHGKYKHLNHSEVGEKQNKNKNSSMNYFHILHKNPFGTQTAFVERLS